MKTNAILLALLIFCMSLAGCISQTDGVAEVTLTDDQVDAIVDEHLDEFLENISIVVNEEITNHHNNSYNNTYNNNTYSNTYNSSSSFSQMSYLHGSVTLQCIAIRAVDVNQPNGSAVNCDDDRPEDYWLIIQNLTTINQSSGQMIKIHSTTGPAIVSGYGGIRTATQCSDGGESGWMYIDGIGPYGSIESGNWLNFNQSSTISHSEALILAFAGEECVHTIYSSWIFDDEVEFHWNVLYEVVEL